MLSQDYDFYLSPEKTDLKSLLALAKDMDLEVSVKKPEDRPFFSLLGDNLKLDFFRARRYGKEAGTGFTFDELFARKTAIRLKGFEVYVPSLEDLIRSKEVRNSPKDREDLKYLHALLERGER